MTSTGLMLPSVPLFVFVFGGAKSWWSDELTFQVVSYIIPFLRLSIRRRGPKTVSIVIFVSMQRQTEWGKEQRRNDGILSRGTLWKSVAKVNMSPRRCFDLFEAGHRQWTGKYIDCDNVFNVVEHHIRWLFCLESSLMTKSWDETIMKIFAA